MKSSVLLKRYMSFLAYISHNAPHVVPPPYLARSLFAHPEFLSIGVVVEAMMAAAGCGSATAAAAVGAGAARGRFPGRPWSSRSRLRSEKRWQLGRSGTDQDEISSSGGPRPTCLVFALNEDQSHLRLLGIEASYKSLGEAGYSSSGSEEVGARVKSRCLYTTRSWPCFAWPCCIGRNSNVSLVHLQSPAAFNKMDMRATAHRPVLNG